MKLDKTHTHAGFQIYPPPTTPPEPAPPDNIIGPSMMRQYNGNLVSASQSSLDDITCKRNKQPTIIIKIYSQFTLFVIKQILDYLLSQILAPNSSICCVYLFFFWCCAMFMYCVFHFERLHSFFVSNFHVFLFLFLSSWLSLLFCLLKLILFYTFYLALSLILLKFLSECAFVCLAHNDSPAFNSHTHSPT